MNRYLLVVAASILCFLSSCDFLKCGCEPPPKDNAPIITIIIRNADSSTIKYRSDYNPESISLFTMQKGSRHYERNGLQYQHLSLDTLGYHIVLRHPGVFIDSVTTPIYFQVLDGDIDTLQITTSSTSSAYYSIQYNEELFDYYPDAENKFYIYK